MKIYHYDNLGVFVNSSDARVSPLEPGTYLIPARATTIPPMIPVAGKARVFTAGAWTRVTDARGRYYNQDRQEVYITDLGVELPAGWTVEPRPRTQAEIEAIAAQEAREADIEAAQSDAGLKQYTVAQGGAWIDTRLNAATTLAELRTELKTVLKKMMPYILPR